MEAKIDRAVEVRADADRVAQVLRNLSANALWHTPPQGHIAAEAQPIEQGWRISVTDTGEGIVPEEVIMDAESCQNLSGLVLKR